MASGTPHFTNLARPTTSRLGFALGLTLAFVIVEMLAGLWANSLVLLTDAAHNLTDVMALALSLYALRLTTQPAHSGKTFGYHRAGILVALVNSTILVVITLEIFYEAYQRLWSPPAVNSNVLIGVATLAFIVNTSTAWLVYHGSRHDLGLRSAFMHLAGDAISTMGAVFAGVLMVLTGMNLIDPLMSLFIGMLILWNAWLILREIVDILLESTPRDVDMNKMVRDLMGIEGVRGVHDLHVWSITQSLRALSAHVLIDDVMISKGVQTQREISAMLRQKYGIAHSTLQLECAGCEPERLYCDLTDSGPDPTHQGLRSRQ